MTRKRLTFFDVLASRSESTEVRLSPPATAFGGAPGCGEIGSTQFRLSVGLKLIAQAASLIKVLMTPGKWAKPSSLRSLIWPVATKL
jgi:hypothetical protein